MKSVALHNLGCKVNSYEIDVMQQMLQEKGYKIVSFDKKADIYIVNTCTVTNIADRKSRQMLHRAKKMNPEAVVVATGCYVQTGEEEIVLDDAIDLAVGNNKKKELVSILESFLAERDQQKQVDNTNTVDNMNTVHDMNTVHVVNTIHYVNRADLKTMHHTTIIDINDTDEYEELFLKQTSEHTRAYIKIQDGCNQFCSYCIIPYARGRVRSRSMEDIILEISNLCVSGYKEVVLTGIHISSYGVDFEKRPMLLELIQKINQIEGVERIRLGSLEPRIVTEEFAKSIGELTKICPHFHLSLQSGCDETLKRMNRRYSASEYEQGVSLLRKYFVNPAITTDVIVGFPGETEEEFLQTREFVEKINFSEMHIFPFSKRQGTKAAEMKEQIKEEIKKSRSAELLALEKKHSQQYRMSQIGKIMPVLFEESKEIDGIVYQVGHTTNYVKVMVQKAESLTNQIVDCLMEKEAESGCLMGVIQ